MATSSHKEFLLHTLCHSCLHWCPIPNWSYPAWMGESQTQTYRYCCACGRTSTLAMVQVVCLPNAWLRTVLKISSVLEGKGKRNNPNVKEFREVLRAAMVDVILPQSDSSNCAEDADRFLLTLIAFSKYTTTSTAVESFPVPEPAETQFRWLTANPCPPSVDSFLVSCEESVLFYVAGYFAQKVCANVCDVCQALLTGSL